MRQHILLCVGLVVLTVGGCTFSAAGWPAGYREAICAGTDHLRAAHDTVAEAADGIDAADAERVAIAAAAMERESDDALEAIGGAPRWELGEGLNLALTDAAVAFGRAATEFGVGARQGIGPALDRAIALAQDADISLGRADLEGERLRSAIGWQPC